MVGVIAYRYLHENFTSSLIFEYLNNALYSSPLRIRHPPSFHYGGQVFISYRHNDNLDGWVTEFVNNLNKELVYFDVNLHHNLLETHSVET